jgi:hypothetical protein
MSDDDVLLGAEGDDLADDIIGDDLLLDDLDLGVLDEEDPFDLPIEDSYDDKDDF